MLYKGPLPKGAQFKPVPPLFEVTDSCKPETGIIHRLLA